MVINYFLYDINTTEGSILRAIILGGQNALKSWNNTSIISTRVLRYWSNLLKFRSANRVNSESPAGLLHHTEGINCVRVRPHSKVPHRDYLSNFGPQESRLHALRQNVVWKATVPNPAVLLWYDSDFFCSPPPGNHAPDLLMGGGVVQCNNNNNMSDPGYIVKKLIIISSRSTL